MTEQIGVMVVHEPLWTDGRLAERVQKNIPTNLMTYIFALSATTEVRDDYEAALAQLRAEDPAKEWVDLAFLHDAKVKRLQAENADLTAKLAAANVELHRLRISR